MTGFNEFYYRDENLYCEDTNLKSVAESFGTPVFVYSRRVFEDAIRGYQTAFPDAEICYAVKSNGNPHLVRIAGEAGCGADIVSEGELRLALKSGIPADKIAFAGVGKTRDEMTFALDAGIRMFNVESLSELYALNEAAGGLDKKAPVAIRVNPNVDIHTHEYIATGKKETKFGVDIDDSIEVFRRAYELPYINLKGVHIHVGSQLLECKPYVDGIRAVLGLVKTLERDGIHLDTLDLGGGLGIRYEPGDNPIAPSTLAESITSLLDDTDFQIVLEPGRSLSGSCGVFLTKILYIKKSKNKLFYIVDGAMTEMIRPALYKAYHEILPLAKNCSDSCIVDVVGPVCESGDFLARDRQLPEMKEGDLLAVMSAGAYGYSMASNYNMRPRPAEVLISGSETKTIRSRETLDFLLRS